MAGTKKKRPTVKLTEEQKKERNKKRRDAAFRRKIRMTLTNAGFQYFPTTDKHFSIGHRKVELASMNFGMATRKRFCSMMRRH